MEYKYKAVFHIIVLRVLMFVVAASGGVIVRIAFGLILWEALALFGRIIAAASSLISLTDTGRPPSSSSSEKSSSDPLLLLAASVSLSPSFAGARGFLVWSWNNLGDYGGGGGKKKEES